MLTARPPAEGCRSSTLPLGPPGAHPFPVPCCPTPYEARMAKLYVCFHPAHAGVSPLCPASEGPPGPLADTNAFFTLSFARPPPLPKGTTTPLLLWPPSPPLGSYCGTLPTPAAISTLSLKAITQCLLSKSILKPAPSPKHHYVACPALIFRTCSSPLLYTQIHVTSWCLPRRTLEQNTSAYVDCL